VVDDNSRRGVAHLIMFAYDQPEMIFTERETTTTRHQINLESLHLLPKPQDRDFSYKENNRDATKQQKANKNPLTDPEVCLSEAATCAADDRF